MHWKRYKALPQNEKRSESMYVIGIDIGSDSSCIAYYNFSDNAPETIDLSGGYGKPSIPTVMQYMTETKEWVFGEYAILNRGAGAQITLTSLVDKLGSGEYFEIDRKPASVASILALYIKELLSHVKNINPKAEIAGIVASVPSYLSGGARDELARAFKSAGYEKELVALVSDRECVFTRHYAFNKPREEHALLLDYGSSQVRGGLYHTVPRGEEISVKSVSSLFDDEIGTKKINDDVFELFFSFCKTKMQAVPQGSEELIHAFAYQHRDVLFQKNIRAKPVKLYFNFAYPPFQQTVEHTRIDFLTAPYKKAFNNFVSDVMNKNVSGVEEIGPGDVSGVVCVGGGFEMLWARDAVGEIFDARQIKFHKNAKTVAAEGAALVAALLLGAADGYKIIIEDRHQLSSDIGFVTGADGFLPIAERNAFWWQKHPERLIWVNEHCGGSLPLKLAKRNADGIVKPIADIPLDGLPSRPKGTTRVSMKLAFSSESELTATVADFGFGELFPKADCVKTYNVNIA